MLNLKSHCSFIGKIKKRNWKAMDVKCVGVRIKIGCIGIKRLGSGFNLDRG